MTFQMRHFMVSLLLTLIAMMIAPPTAVGKARKGATTARLVATRMATEGMKAAQKPGILPPLHHSLNDGEAKETAAIEALVLTQPSGSPLCQAPALEGSCSRMRDSVKLAVVLAAKRNKVAAITAQNQCREFAKEYPAFVERVRGLSRATFDGGAEGLNSGKLSMIDSELDHGSAFCHALLNSSVTLDISICAGVVPVGNGISYGVALQNAREALQISSAPPCAATPVSTPGPLVASASQMTGLGSETAGSINIAHAAQVGGIENDATQELQKPILLATSSMKPGEIKPPWKRPVRIAVAVGLSAIAIGLAVTGVMDLAQGHGLEMDVRAAQAGLTPREYENRANNYRSAYAKGGIETSVAAVAVAGAAIFLGVDFTKRF